MNVALKPSFGASSVTFSISGCFVRPPNSNGAGGKSLSSPTSVGTPNFPTNDGTQSALTTEDMIVVCDNVVTLYEVQQQNNMSSSSGSPTTATTIEALAKQGALKFVATTTLATSPTGIGKVSITRDRPDQLILTFDHEHMSIIYYDALTCMFITSALFRVGDQTIAKDDVGVPSIIAVDPLNRCIAMLLRRRYLAIVPIYKYVDGIIPKGGEAATTTTSSTAAPAAAKAAAAVDDWGDEDDYAEEEGAAANKEATTAATTDDMANNNMSASGDAPAIIPDYSALPPLHRFLGQPKYIDLLALPDRIRSVRDMAFVPATTGEPTIAFLCEREATWAGRVKLIDVAAGRRTANLATCNVAWLVIQAATMGDGASPEQALQTHQALTQLVPFNATRLVPCNLPGCDAGFLVLCANSILHVTRTRAAGFFLNDYGREEATCSTNTKVHWSKLQRPQRKVERITEHNISFADACAAMIGPFRAVVACPVSGLLCILDIGISGRDVNAMNCVPVAPAAIASAVSVIHTGAHGSHSSFFLGSAVGDSLIFSISAIGAAPTSTDASNTSHTTVKAFPWPRTILRNYGPIVSSDLGDFSTKEELLVDTTVGTANTADEKKAAADGADDESASASATVLTNPYKDILAQAVAPDAPAAFVPLQDTLAATDLIVAGGEGEFGHVTIARQSIRPNVLFSQQADCVSLFVADPSAAAAVSNVAGQKRSRDDEVSPSASAADAAQFLFLSFVNSTLLYKLGATVTPVEATDTPFDIASRTVWAGVAGGRCAVEDEAVVRFVQVTDRSVVIAKTVVTPAAAPLVSSTAAGEEKAADDTTAEGETPAAAAPTSSLELVAGIELIEAAAAEATTAIPVVLKHAFLLANTSLLCATSTAGIAYLVDVVNPSVVVLNDLLTNADASLKITAVCDAAESGLATAVSPSSSLLVVDSTGTLRVVTIDTSAAAAAGASPCVTVTTIPQFAALPQMIIRGNVVESQLDLKKGRAANSNKALPEIMEMLVVVSGSTPFLYLLSACGEVAVYKIRPADVSLFKLDQRFVDRDFSEEKLESLEEKKRKLNLAADEVTVQDTTAKVRPLTQRLVKFTNIVDGYNTTTNNSSTNASSGVFVCGRRSSVFMAKDGGKLVHHHLQASGPLRSFCELNTQSTTAKFIVAGEGYISFCALERRTNYLENNWCVRREPIRKTPHCVGYMSQSRSCFVVTSEQTPFRPARAPFDMELKISVDEETGNPMATGVVPRVVQPYLPITGGVPVPMNDRYTVNLYNAHPWQHSDALVLEENEQVLCSGVGTLLPETDGVPTVDAKGIPTAMTVFAIGTAFPLGEDTTCRGRLLLLKASVTPPSNSNDADEDNANNLTSSAYASAPKVNKKTIITIHTEDCKGPVSALAFVKTYIAATVGGTIKIYALDTKNERLVTMSFLGAGNFVPKMLGFKNFLLFGDLFASVSMAKIHSGDKSTYILAKHSKEVEVSAIDIIYKASEMGIIVGGAEGNVLLLSYQGQRDRDGNIVGGRMNEEASFRLSAGMTTTNRIRVPKANKAELSDDAVVLYTTAGGELGFVHPVTERAARTLNAVTKTLATALYQPAGLDPSSFKAIPCEDLSKGVFTPNLLIDGDGANTFMMLSLLERAQVAAAAKVSPDGVLNVLCGLSEQSYLLL